MTNRADILELAKSLTTGDRNETHGDAQQQHALTATLWTQYLTHKHNGKPPAERQLTGEDAAIMMTLVKISRIACGGYNPDNYVDAAAYMAIAGECASG